MKRLHLLAAVLAFLTMTAGIILRSGAAAMTGWVLTAGCFSGFLKSVNDTFFFFF